jgi:hypothetical protein
MTRSFSPVSALGLGRLAWAMVGAFLLVGRAMPAKAALINYSFSGEYGNSDGPLIKDSLVATMTSDAVAYRAIRLTVLSNPGTPPPWDLTPAQH